MTHWEHKPLRAESPVGPRRWPRVPRAGAGLALSHGPDPTGLRDACARGRGCQQHCHQLWLSRCPAQLWRCKLPYFSGVQTAWRRLVWRAGFVLLGGRTFRNPIPAVHGAGWCWAGLQWSPTAQLAQGILHLWEWCLCSRLPALCLPRWYLTEKRRLLLPKPRVISLLWDNRACEESRMLRVWRGDTIKCWFL